jgi:hypothetical protein
VIISFALAALTCLFAALSYSELAASIPVSGSAYTYAYATMGEFVAWILGWNLILEYGVAVAAVLIAWSVNLNSFLDTTFEFTIPDAISASPEGGGVINLVSVAMVAVVTALLDQGRQGVGAHEHDHGGGQARGAGVLRRRRSHRVHERQLLAVLAHRLRRHRGRRGNRVLRVHRLRRGGRRRRGGQAA